VKVLVFRHAPFEGIGRIASVFHERAISYQYADLYREGQPTPDIAAYDGLIFLGGPMSANDPLPYLDRERALISQAVDRGQPLLGVCLGSQLIARCLGAAIHRNPQKEIGWFDLQFTKSAENDAIFSGIDGPETVFHWHSDTWELPHGAVLLASSELCANQAFRAGANIYGLQFHLEITPEMIADWQTQPDNCGDVCDLPVPLDPQRNSARLDHLSKEVFGRWCTLL
jgi:GMP synthase-like glutamine amidotransferase